MNMKTRSVVLREISRLNLDPAEIYASGKNGSLIIKKPKNEEIKDKKKELLKEEKEFKSIEQSDILPTIIDSLDKTSENYISFEEINQSASEQLQENVETPSLATDEKLVVSKKKTFAKKK